MTTLREAAQQALEALIHMCHNTLADKGYDGQLVQDAIDGLKGSLARTDTHPQCAQGCEFLAMEQRRNEREATLKDRGFE
jgi:hypothetical protein